MTGLRGTEGGRSTPEEGCRGQPAVTSNQPGGSKSRAPGCKVNLTDPRSSDWLVCQEKGMCAWSPHMCKCCQVLLSLYRSRCEPDGTRPHPGLSGPAVRRLPSAVISRSLALRFSRLVVLWVRELDVGDRSPPSRAVRWSWRGSPHVCSPGKAKLSIHVTCHTVTWAFLSITAPRADSALSAGGREPC